MFINRSLVIYRQFTLFVLSVSILIFLNFQNSFGQETLPTIVEANVSCGQIESEFEIIKNWADNSDNAHILIIARLGDGERNRIYSVRRLNQIRKFLETHGTSKDKITTSQGSRVSGNGRVDVYIGGKPFMFFKVRRGKNVQFDKCCACV